MIATSNRRKTAVCIGLSLLALLLAGAPQAFADDERDLGTSAKTQAYIAETRMIAPLRIGDFVLEGRKRFDDPDKFGGIAFRYLHPDYPQIRVDVFVYPIGKTDPEQALRRGMRDFVASMQPAIKAGMYRNFVEGDTTEFDLDLAPDADTAAKDASGTATAASRETPGATSGNHAEDRAAGRSDRKKPQDPNVAKREAMLEQLLTAGRRIDGQRMNLSFEYRLDGVEEWVPMRSRTYLFYRHLHYFKGRISAANSQIDEAAFAALTDRAMRELVPALQAYNIGSCGDSTIYVNPNASEEDTADQLMRSFLEATARKRNDNCHRSADEAQLRELAKDASIETFTYSAADWGDK